MGLKAARYEAEVALAHGGPRCLRWGGGGGGVEEDEEKEKEVREKGGEGGMREVEVADNDVAPVRGLS